MEKSEKLDCIPHTHIGGWWDIYMYIYIYIYTCIDIDIAIVRIPIRGRMTKNIQTILRHGTYRVTPISRCHLPGINQSCRTPCFSPFQPDFFFTNLGIPKSNGIYPQVFHKKIARDSTQPVSTGSSPTGSTLDRYLNTNYFCLQHKIDSNWYIYICIYIYDIYI